MLSVVEPRLLDDGMVLRSATEADLDGIVALSVDAHGEHEAWGVRYVFDRDGPAAWTVVVDDDEIVSASVLMSHRLLYDDVELTAGQIEYVATAESHRRRGLVRLQVEEHHRRADARGDRVVFIAGIPYFYRRLGYAYGLRYPPRYHLPRNSVEMPDGWTVGPAEPGDRPAMQALHDRALAAADVRIPMSGAEWDALLSTAPKWGEGVLVARHGERVGGWMRLQEYPEIESFEVLQAATDELAAAEALVVHAQRLAGDANLGLLGRHGDPWSALLTSVGFPVDDFHGLYTRIADPAAFLGAVSPVLSRRLASSPLRNEVGELVISLYEESLTVDYDRGEITGVRVTEGVEDPGDVDGVGVAPDAFCALVFGVHGATALAARVEDVVLGRHGALMEVLFPPLVADVVGVL